MNFIGDNNLSVILYEYEYEYEYKYQYSLISKMFLFYLIELSGTHCPIVSTL
jgi:hypothetical protein